MSGYPDMADLIPFPLSQLDQKTNWVRPNGELLFIKDMNEHQVCWAMDFCLANAAKLRKAWSTATLTDFDTDQRARRWMLDRDVMRALMRRLIQIESEDSSTNEHSKPTADNSSAAHVGIRAFVARLGP